MTAEGSGVALFPKELHPSSTPDDVEPPAIRVLHIAFRLDRAGFETAARRSPSEAWMRASPITG